MIAQIRETLTVRDVLRSAGVDMPGRGRMVCPVHQGDNPTAFSIFDAGRRWHCHTRCGTGGDVIDLAAALHSLSTRDAIRHCAALGGITQHITSRENVAASIERRHRERDARAAREDAWRERWLDAIAAVDRAREDCAVVQVLMRRDPDETDPQTRATLDRIGDAYTREQCALAAVDKLERLWRAAREAA